MRKILKLAEGRTVPMEDGRDWPAQGATVDVTLYIRRRLRDGDLVEVPDVSTTEDPPRVEDPPLPAVEGETVTVRKGGKAGGKHG